MNQQYHGHTSPLRYPGGKRSLANFIKIVIAQNNLLDGEYVEVYAGGASIAWALLFEEYVRCVHVNDLNTPIMLFWRSVLEDTDEFCRIIQETPVTIEEWYRQKMIQVNFQNHSPIEVGFSTFFLNRTNRSGILKGGIIGGKSQTGKWKLDARFNKKDLIQRIQRIGRYENRIRLYEQDAEKFIRDTLPNITLRSLVYLDPPYYNKGQGLYENHYEKKDHTRIAQIVKNHIRQPWIVSYDATDEILDIYGEFPSIRYDINYSARDRYAGSEVIFYSNHIRVPQAQNPTTLRLPTMMRPLF